MRLMFRFHNACNAISVLYQIRPALDQIQEDYSHPHSRCISTMRVTAEVKITAIAAAELSWRLSTAIISSCWQQLSWFVLTYSVVDMLILHMEQIDRTGRKKFKTSSTHVLAFQLCCESFFHIRSKQATYSWRNRLQRMYVCHSPLNRMATTEWENHIL